MHRKAPLAKISRPRLFDVVPRERLFRLLDANRGRPLIWITSPPGAGKTALVASYLEGRSIPAIWYQIDTGDADPAGFFHYMSLAAEQAGAGEAALPRFSAEHFSDLRSFARLYFRALFERLPSEALVVLDNYQELPEEALLHEVVEELVRQTPTDSSVVCISRLEPPLSLAILEANGATCLINWDRLKLTLDEVGEISNRHGISDSWILKTLHQQSQGWAAGVTLMLERLRHLEGPAQELPMDSRESVFNYFASLIFDRAPEKTQQVLVSIAFLPHVASSIAVALSGQEDAPMVLENLYQRRLFTDRRSLPESQYQFHALFLQFLREKARRSLRDDELNSLLRRSALLLERAGETEPAVELWVMAADWEKASSLILREANSLLKRGRRETLQKWITALPEQVAKSEPWLLYWLGLAQVQTAPGIGIGNLQRALQGFRRKNEARGHVLCLAALLNAAFLDFLDLSAMHKWLDELLETMDRASSLLSKDIELRVWGVLCSALFWIRPWHPWAQEAAAKVASLLDDNIDPHSALTASSSALATASMSGQFDYGDAIASRTEALIENSAAGPPEAVWWLVHAGFLRFFEARYEESLEYMRRAGDVARENGLRKTSVMATFHRCAVEFRVLGWSAASVTLREMEAMPAASYPMAKAMLYLLKAREAQFRGERNNTAELAEAAEAAAMKIGSQYQEMLFGLIESELLVDAGRLERARTLLNRSKAIIAKAPVFDCWRAALLFVESWLEMMAGETENARTAVTQALVLAKDGPRKYYLRHFECAMPPMFLFALREGIEEGLVRELIWMFRLRPPREVSDLWPWPVRIYTMGRFKVEIRGAALEFPRKVPRKTLLLLKALVARGSTDVPESALCDALWGDEEADAASNALAISIVRLRKLLGGNETVLQQGGKISLNLDLCWVDAWAFERHLSDARESKAIELYAGTFLPDEQGEGWSVAARERLRGKFINALSAQGESLERHDDLQLAVECYQRGIDADPIIESFHQGLMRCYERLGRRSEALSVYRRLRQTLSVVLGVPPAESTQQLFQQMLQRQIEEGGSSGERLATQAGSDRKVRVLPTRRTQKR